MAKRKLLQILIIVCAGAAGIYNIVDYATTDPSMRSIPDLFDPVIGVFWIFLCIWTIHQYFTEAKKPSNKKKGK